MLIKRGGDRHWRCPRQPGASRGKNGNVLVKTGKRISSGHWGGGGTWGGSGLGGKKKRRVFSWKNAKARGIEN